MFHIIFQLSYRWLPNSYQLWVPGVKRKDGQVKELLLQDEDEGDQRFSEGANVAEKVDGTQTLALSSVRTECDDLKVSNHAGAQQYAGSPRTCLMSDWLKTFDSSPSPFRITLFPLWKCLVASSQNTSCPGFTFWIIQTTWARSQAALRTLAQGHHNKYKRTKRAKDINNRHAYVFIVLSTSDLKWQHQHLSAALWSYLYVWPNNVL